MRHAFAQIPAGRIHYQTEGEGEPLLCLHQSIWSNWEYARLIPLLAKKYRVIAPDTIGFGKSDTAPIGWMIPDYANSILQFMDAIGVKKARLIGQHTGALLSVELTAAHPERFHKVVFSGLGLFNADFVPWSTNDPTGLWMITSMTQNLRERIANRSWPWQYEILMDGSHLLRWWTNQLHENPAAEMDGIQKAFIAVMEHWDKRGGNPFAALLAYDLTARARKVAVPSLLTVGTKDCFYPPICQNPEVMVGIIPGCTMKYIQDAGIMGLYTHPQEYARVILDFLA
jgi:pimeloyl-ACP methyl ester carboxylesterase